jgi:hypothetical protein
MEIYSFLFLSNKELYYSSIIFLARWAMFSLIRIWQWKICGELYMYYTRKITT